MAALSSSLPPPTPPLLLLSSQDDDDDDDDDEKNLLFNDTNNNSNHMRWCSQPKNRRKQRLLQQPDIIVVVVLLLLLVILLAPPPQPPNLVVAAFATTTSRNLVVIPPFFGRPQQQQQQQRLLAFATTTAVARRRRVGGVHHHSTTTIHGTSTSTSTSTTTRLYSLQQFLQEQMSRAASSRGSTASTATATMPPATTQQQQTILVGGKGGVGKTSISAALAIQLATGMTTSTTSDNKPTKILIVSTDPAHSLGDALDIDLRSSRGGIVKMDTTTLNSDTNNVELYAQEIDATSALRDLQEQLAVLDITTLSQTLNINIELLESLGIRDLSSMFQNPPPGLDELMALSNIFFKNQNNNNKDDSTATNNNFDIVIVDTAPTGHTLRLLALPQFLDGILSKIILIRSKLSTLTNAMSSFFGGSGSSTADNNSDTTQQQQQRQKALDNAMNKLQQLQLQMQQLRTVLQTSDKTQFIVVTIPTTLGIAETKRLVSELQQQSIAVSNIVVNQCIDSVDNDDDNNGSDATTTATTATAYYNRRVSQQQRWMNEMIQAAQKVSSSSEYQQNHIDDDNNDRNQITVTSVPYMDVELVGIPALGYIGHSVYPTNPAFSHLILGGGSSDNKQQPPKVVICGGKGGVGKTTTSASLAITMAVTGGHKVALISTDPAHSLGDAVQMNLQQTGGTLQECSLVGVPGYNPLNDGSLSVLEIDPTAALNQFKGLVDQLVMGGGSGGGDTMDSGGGFRETIRELQQVFDTLPAGTDEVVALAKIVNLIKKGGYDRVVLDTAPTGHTLRMLSTPGFLADLIDRVLRISDTINTNPLVQLWMNTSKRRDEIKAAIETAKSTLLSFQFQMYDLEDLWSNPSQTEFVIVTIPTELAVRESIRLLHDLTFEAPDMPIKVRNIIVNQVLQTDDNSSNDNATGAAASTFLSHLARTQQSSIAELERFVAAQPSTTKIGITKVPYLDTEPRGIYGLKALGAALTTSDE